ncbi:hypothetical protein EAF07_01235 [Streptococcus hillyeri]|uniref:Uncharacterized protein n=1 Tax=Streptococcus hillyeri TaxID=2282420 RepID=A0A3L9E1W7_9STRE|nr:hypothetical protein EAF07_01235 [Streptococcus hillyeri]
MVLLVWCVFYRQFGLRFQ